MKKLLLATFFMLTIGAVPAFSHCGMCGMDKTSDEASSDDWAQKKLDQMTETLGLSAEQQAQVKAALDAKMAKKKAVKGQMDAIHEEFHEALKTILTPEQHDKAKSLWEEKGGKSCEKCCLHGAKGSSSDDKGSMSDDKGSMHDHGEHKGSH